MELPVNIRPLLSERFHLLLAGVIGVPLALVVGYAAGSGELLGLSLTGLAILLGIVMLQLGPKYWYILPMAFSCELPTIPIHGKAAELPEVAVLVCGVVFVCRYALKVQRATLKRLDFVPIALYAAWAAFIFVKNPIGLSWMGASVGGARFYLKIAMGLVAFFVLANQEIDERDAKRIVIMIVVGVLVSLPYNIYFWFSPGDWTMGDSSALQDGPSYYTWHQALSAPALLISTLLFARYRSSEIVSIRNTSRLLLLIFCVPLFLMSGKRAAIAMFPIIVLAAAFVRREYRFLLLWAGILCFAASAIVFGQGRMFHLPETAQRGISWLPANWDAEIKYSQASGLNDEFRAELRRLAWEKIDRDPWIGRGYAVDFTLLNRMAIAEGNAAEADVIGHALNSNWHTTWLACWADFGFPAVILQAIIYLHVILRSRALWGRLPADSMRACFVMYVLLTTITAVIRSHTSGHSALLPFLTWWTYGIVFGILFGLKNGHKRPDTMDGTDYSPAAMTLADRVLSARMQPHPQFRQASAYKAH